MGLSNIACVTVSEEAKNIPGSIPEVTSELTPELTPEVVSETGWNSRMVSLTFHLHHPISVTMNKPHIYMNEMTSQKYPQLSPHASEDFIKVE